MIKGIQVGYSEEDIKLEIEAKGFSVAGVHREKKLYREPNEMKGVREGIPVVLADLKKKLAILIKSTKQLAFP